MKETNKKHKFDSELLQILIERGFIHQTSNESGLDEYFKSNKTIGYIGFDLTAKSLHVGSLLQIMLLKWLQDYGHKPILLLGGGTTLIGDPSGKDETRKILLEENINDNENGIKRVFSKFLDLDKKKLIIENNKNWLKDLNYISFLREYGKHFTINRMLTFDSVKIRLEREQPLTFLEFNYMLLQAYDFLELYKRHDCKLQLGGSDQWGNIVNGIELVRRVTGAETYAITTPLITTASGAKMGKTADGAIWLDEELTSPYDFWQFWRNTDDRDVIKFLKLFTTLPISEIDKLAALEGSEINEAKKILANEITRMTHGSEISEKIYQSALETFEGRIISQNLPKHLITLSHDSSIGLLNLLVTIGFAKSNSEARKAIANGAIKINDISVSDPNIELKREDLEGAKIAFGKKRNLIIEVSN
ncbi:MAG: tyrosine--tRNA ligase [Hyphomicrobiales bacterium]